MMLQGHGDPLLSAAVKDWNISDAKTDDAETEAHHSPAQSGHGDPLFQATEMHSTPQPLHACFMGHGDALMEAALKEWGQYEQVFDKAQDEAGHSPFQFHGDPLFEKFLVETQTTEDVKKKK
mmetsp:Transcript_16851/g.23083  ORF Transcript_16851/g.23083 Transcript_16851/m.23083 type:complete len:122 (-) Transcript_16851:89-454(-)|eukprot:CAMPEP_0185740206 /NCGR_PEP_ID=MMETSP1171-20130828/37276_1 /TAXON_ID=374046 /ORGANISM="Helicotheca tamensis, Strain CCMP826" /LENGTH=121 /DNA_ID=CAMNT_0028411995 /DNA_START=92 /DNA_END=457 /DNA_ORIENTATION=+